ncbi:MAG: DUF4159 domain-containing protein [Candidatus Latescibacteria bacterium]|nr:DUF4159 domain-containing protein [Candidatus Latescibacterota bacterium]
MPPSPRFTGPAAALDLRRLSRRQTPLIGGCLALGLLVHIGLFSLSLDRTEGPQSRPLTSRFIQRQPRLTKPMELRKKPKPRQRRMQRQETKLQARRTQLNPQWQSAISLRHLQVPDLALSPQLVSVSIPLATRPTHVPSTTKEPAQKLALREHLLNIDYLDTGQYQAMVIQDPKDKRNIQGFFHLAQVYTATMVQRNIQISMRNGAFSPFTHPNALQHLVSSINEYTQIKADMAPRLSLSDKELMDTPWIYVPPMRFTLNEGELSNLGRYLERGGFFVADAGRIVGGETDSYLRLMLRDALRTVGRRARFERLAKDHPLFHCYFDFDGPPASPYSWNAGTGRANVDYLIGVHIDDRLAAVLTYQSLGAAWQNFSGPGFFNDNTRHLQFGINLVVFALTQKGSITHQVMQVVD